MSAAEPTVVNFAVEGSLARLTIDREAARNALNAAVFDGLAAALDALPEHPAVRAVLITGAGEKAFCAGADLDELRGLSASAARVVLDRGRRVFDRIEALPVPTIAMVRGWALGGGFELALACSFIVADETARFGLPEAGLGLIPGYGGTQRLPRAIGRNAALACMLADLRIEALHAWQLGLLARPPVDALELEPVALELASRIETRGPGAVTAILDAVRAGDPLEPGLSNETALAAIATGSSEAAEGVAAFLEKRPPTFSPIVR